MKLIVGSIVELKLPCLGNKPGTLGVCFYDYQLGVQILFANGSHDGFSEKEQKVYLRKKKHKSSVQYYKFKNPALLTKDFVNGFFDEALKLRKYSESKNQMDLFSQNESDGI